MEQDQPWISQFSFEFSDLAPPQRWTRPTRRSWRHLTGPLRWTRKRSPAFAAEYAMTRDLQAGPNTRAIDRPPPHPHPLLRLHLGLHRSHQHVRRSPVLPVHGLMIVNSGNARLAGLETDLGLVGYDYNVCLSAFFVSYSWCCAFDSNRVTFLLQFFLRFPCSCSANTWVFSFCQEGSEDPLGRSRQIPAPLHFCVWPFLNVQ
jgi:hypothetical protein